MSRIPVKPFLIQKDAEGCIRLTVRETRLNQWNYPIVKATMIDAEFNTISAARAHAREHFGAEPGQFATR